MPLRLMALTQNMSSRCTSSPGRKIWILVFYHFQLCLSVCEKWPLNSYKLIFAIEYQWPLYLVKLCVLVIITPFLFINWIGWQKMLCKYVVTQSICIHYSCFENMGRFVTLKKIRSKIWTWKSKVKKTGSLLFKKRRGQAASSFFE